MATDNYTPRPEDKFTFGLWTVGNRGRDHGTVQLLLPIVLCAVASLGLVMPAVAAFSTFSIRISRSTELALSSRSPARERWRLRLLRYFPGAELAPDRNAATLARRGTTLKKGRSPIAI